MIIGCAQCLALLPGVSRSGITITAALILGFCRTDAARFSFLLSIPAILGAAIVQSAELGGWHQFIAALPHQWYLGAIVAFISGFAALVVLRKIVLSSKWWIFGVYCLILGISVITATYMGAW